MRLRLKPTRGQKFMVEGEECTYLEDLKSFKTRCRMLNSSGMIVVVEKYRLEMPEIDTNNYEKAS